MFKGSSHLALGGPAAVVGDQLPKPPASTAPSQCVRVTGSNVPHAISFHHEAEYLRGVEASAMQGEVICVGGSLLALWTRLTIAKIMPEGGWSEVKNCVFKTC